MRLFFIFFTILLALTLIQCRENPVVSEERSLFKGPGNGGGNKGGGKGGGEKQDYGDLVVCLRNADGIPIYKEIVGEHGLSYYPQPIKFDELTLIPVKIGFDYVTFELNDEGEVIPEAGYIAKEVEFGRLNLVRAPQPVLNQALDEAIKALQQSVVSNILTDASGRLVAIIGAEDWKVNFDDDPNNDEDDDKTIDSPRENMAIYQELLSNGLNGKLGFLRSAGFDDDDVLNLAASAVAAGADKTGTINVDEIAYMNDWIVDWDNIAFLGPDEKERRYFDFGTVTYSRESTYGSKYVRITTLNPDGTWNEDIAPLLTVMEWTNPDKLIDYAQGLNTNITGFANAADDAVQVLEFIHSSDMIEYSPYFLP